MRLIPTHCKACGRFLLMKQSELQFGETICAQCGARAFALPGESYAESDRSLFDGFADTLREAGIDAAKATQLLRELEGGRKGRSSGGILELAQVQPSLGNLEVIALQHPRRKADGVLLLLLSAIANRRTQSGFLRAFGEDPGHAGGKLR
jgi:hypothetical protein